MYVPEKRIIRHGLADFKPVGPDMDYEGWKQIAREYKETAEKRSREQDDLYDTQTRQANEMDAILEGTSGKDYEYLQKSIVNSRDELKNLYKGKTVKETKSPEFQKKLYDIRQGLASKKNGIETTYEQIKAADAWAKSNPSTIQDEYMAYRTEQLNLPPDQRDKNFLATVQTSPKMFSAYNLIDYNIQNQKEATEKTREITEDSIYDYNATYRSNIGHFVPVAGFSDDKTGKSHDFVYDPTDEFVETQLQNKQFYNKMANMLPPEQSEEILGSGNTNAFNNAVKAQAKAFIATVAKQQGYGPDYKKTNQITKWWKHQRPTAADVKDTKENKEINVIKARLDNADPRAFDDQKGELWKNFVLQYDDDGTVIGVEGTREVPDPIFKKKMNPKTEFFALDVDEEGKIDAGSVKRVLNQIKYYKSTDKKYTTPKETNPSTTFNVGGKPYTRKQLLDMKYTPQEIDQWIKDGTLKPN